MAARSAKLRPIRPSAQGIPCGLAYTLSQRFPASSSAAEEGTDKHAAMAEAFRKGEPPADPLLAFGYSRITTLWHNATWETEAPCQLVDPTDGEKLTPDDTGHADLVGALPDGWLVVIDHKFGRVAVDHPDENAQVRVYGAALALGRGAKGFVPVIWQPFVQRDLVIGKPVSMTEVWAIVDDARRAAERDPEVAVTGDHCTKKCYARGHCPEFMLPALRDQGLPAELERLTEQGVRTPEDAALALDILGRLEAIEKRAAAAAKALGGQLETYGHEGGAIPGYRFEQVIKNGRRSGASVETLEKEGLEHLIRPARPSVAFEWRREAK